ncbi:MAG: hypothetical protein LBL80_03210 [Ruminococcus sp.]|jgi:hypothetical protein|nr:hypothetical protein [Ruminococcus sp.]
MSAREMIKQKVDVMPEEMCERILEIIIDQTETRKSRFPDTLEEYMRQKGWNGERINTGEVDWGGFVGDEVPW